MPQIWLKRHLYDELTKRNCNVEQKVDKLVEDFLGVSNEEENLSDFAGLVKDSPGSLFLEKDKKVDKEKNEDAISKGKKLIGLMKKRGKKR